VTQQDAPTVLVTGASGLIGQRVAVLLSAAGRRVIATDVVAAPDSEVPVVECDLRDRAAVEALLPADAPLDGIVHCGGFSGPMVGTSTPQLLLDVNVGGTTNLLELGRQHRLRRFVFASTATAYGRTTGELVDETALPRPENIYAASKLACEALVTDYARHYAAGALNLRLAWVYGPRRTTDCVIRDLLLDAQAGRPTRLPFGHGFPRQFMHVDDAARALVLALDAEVAEPERAYNVTGEDRTTLDEVARIVAEVVPGADIELAPGPDPLDVEQGLFDTTAARRDLGFVPEIGLREGIVSYAAWLAAR